MTSWAAGAGVGDGLGADTASGALAMGAAVEPATLADRTTGCVDLSLGAAPFEDVAIGLGAGLATDTNGWSAGSDAGTGNGVGAGDAACSFAEGVGAGLSEDFAVATSDNFGVRTLGTVTREACTSGVSARGVTCCCGGGTLCGTPALMGFPVTATLFDDVAGAGAGVGSFCEGTAAACGCTASCWSATSFTASGFTASGSTGIASTAMDLALTGCVARETDFTGNDFVVAVSLRSEDF